jgi:hypothetical protein
MEPVNQDRTTPVEHDSNRDEEWGQDKGKDIDYQRREWHAQRIGWAVMVLLVLAALLGLLGGSGPYATARVESSDGSLEAHYMRLERHHAPGRLTVKVDPAFVEAGEVRLWLEADYAQVLEIQSIVPEPESTELGTDRVIYVFTVGDVAGETEITFSYEHDGLWRHQAQLGLENGAPVAFSQFVFP